MSDNIVDGLREWARKGIARNVCRGSRRMSDDITEAADEIERLQSALDAALRDAERWRFARDEWSPHDVYVVWGDANDAADIDRAADAARSAISSERGEK